MIDELHHLPLPSAALEGQILAYRGLIYAVIEGYRPLKLDLYLPQGAGPFPLVVQIHGGAFRMGDRAFLSPILADADLFHWLPQQGFALASIDYRLSGEARFPAQVVDVAAALRWLRARSGELALNPARVALWGESAGAHLALMAGLTPGHPDWNGHAADQPVQAIVDWYGPTDFSQMNAHGHLHGIQDHDAPDSPESQLVGGPLQERPQAVQQANPCRYVRPDAPPVLIQHGTHDRLVPFGQSELLAGALKDAGADVHFEPVEGADHVFLNHPQPEVILGTVLAFLQRHLNGPEDVRPE